jgi:phospholipid/cholesterol/gamma-HCH transport system substrate-binding protein
MTTTAKIGAFFLVVLVLLGVLILKIEDIPIGKKARHTTVEIHFRDVAGLDDKSAVRIAGVRVGKVDGIHLLPDGTALARLALDKDVELRDGAFGQIRSLGMLGDKYVELFPGEVNAPKLAEGKRLEGMVPVGFDDLTKLANDIGKDIKELTSALSGSLGGKAGEERINRIVDNVGALAEEMRRLVESNRSNVDMTLTNLKEFSASIRETLLRVDRILEDNRGNLKSTVANMDELTGKLKTTADNLNSITQKIDSGPGTISKLLNDDETHKNLNEALSSVKSGVDSLNTTLTRVNRLQLDMGFKEEYLGRSGDAKTYFTLDVVPRENKFYRLEVVTQPQGRRYDSTESSTVTFPDGSQQVIQTTTRKFVDEFAFSLQMGYRFIDTQLRAGLIESRGGLGIDQFLFKDKAMITGEVWDFSRIYKTNSPDDKAHLKFTGRYNVNPNLYVTGGVDEFLVPSQRSVFFGAGIKWKDEDFKALIGSIPIK